jgi:hypothetical protein
MTDVKRVWRLGAGADGFCGLALVRNVDVKALHEFRGLSLRQGWRPYAVEPIDDDPVLGQVLGDYARLGTVPTFSERAVVGLRAILEENGELLPLDVKRGSRYYAYNVTRVADVLDEHRSDLERFRSGKVMIINRHAFRLDQMHGLTIFKIPQMVASSVYVTDSFVDQVRDLGLRGFDFEEVSAVPVR